MTARMDERDPMRTPVPVPSLALLIALYAVGQIGVAIYLPSLNAIAQGLGAAAGEVQLTFTLYLFGFAVSQLVYGPLSDRFGRRPVLIAGLVTFTLASIVCSLAPTVEVLIVARFFQALGACAGQVIARASVTDAHEGERGLRMMAYLSMAMGLAPLLAPLIGGQLQTLFGWRANFHFMTLTSLGCLAWVMMGYRETHPPERRFAAGIARLAGNYRRLVSMKAFLGHTLHASLFSAGAFTYLTGAPLVLMGPLGVSAGALGLYTMVMPVGFTVGSLAGARLSARYSVGRALAIGGVISVGAAILHLGLVLAGILTLVSFVAPMLLLSMGNGINFPISVARAVSVDPRIAGTASAGFGFAQMLTAAIVTVAIGNIGGVTPLTISAIITTVGVLSVLSLFLVAADQRHRARP